MLGIQLHEKTDTESVIALLEHTRLQYDKIFVIMDNTGCTSVRPRTGTLRVWGMM